MYLFGSAMDEARGIYLMGGTDVRRLGAVLTSGNWANQLVYCRLG